MIENVVKYRKENMYFIHAETGEILASQTEMTYESGISYNDEIKALLARAKEEKIPLVTFIITRRGILQVLMISINPMKTIHYLELPQDITGKYTSI